jgi:hypothetical protein
MSSLSNVTGPSAWNVKCPDGSEQQYVPSPTPAHHINS